MEDLISVIIPVHNGSATIGKCLEAAFASAHPRFEVIVVDDGSSDGSVEIVRRFPCCLVRLARRAGASRARNIGALHSRGNVLFFTDADCLVLRDTLSLVEKTLAGQGPGAVIGGTYTKEPMDGDFFSRFQSVFINHSETRRLDQPDYIASHAMAMRRSTFLQSGGFPEDFLPIIEDVEFSHRLRRGGCRLVMRPEIQVRHIFNFSLGRSLWNAVRKTRYWTRYSLRNRDLFADSGTASRGLKTNAAAWLASLMAACGAAAFDFPLLFAAVPLIMGVNGAVNFPLLRAFWRTGGPGFGLRAATYYALIYPAAIAAGAVLGLAEYFVDRDRRGACVTMQSKTNHREGACAAS